MFLILINPWLLQVPSAEHHLAVRVRQEPRHGRGQALLHVQVSGKQQGPLPVRHPRLQRCVEPPRPYKSISASPLIGKNNQEMSISKSYALKNILGKFLDSGLLSFFCYSPLPRYQLGLGDLFLWRRPPAVLYSQFFAPYAVYFSSGALKLMKS